MKPDSKFQPVYGTDDAIANEPKISGQLYFSDKGKIYLDTDDGVRIPIADKTVTLVYEQTTPSMTWVINHKLARFPSVKTYDNEGNELIGDLEFTDENSVTVKFTRACTGKAYIN